jgi:hypothetical protein
MGEAELLRLPGIGPRTAPWLLKIGVASYDDLDRLGAVTTYRRLLAAGYPATLNALYALEAVLLDCNWRDLPTSRKEQLRAELDS